MKNFLSDLYPMINDQLRKDIFLVSKSSFEALALEVFRYQFSNNKVYREYCNLLKKGADDIDRITDIPFLPVEFFKTHPIITGENKPEKIFTSSGTTGQQNSRHFVCDLNLYKESFLNAFALFFGDPHQYCILGLLPSYLERPDSSLVYMVEELMKSSGHSLNAFYLYEYDALHSTLHKLEAAGQKTILIGVTFALLDFAEKFSLPLQHTLIMETGGMKGRRAEITRSELHLLLQNSFHTKKISSEYGMTELLSQAYSIHNEKFQTPPWMKILIRDVNDPFGFMEKKSTGAINIIDLANLDSCSFIATSDLGKLNDDDTFEVSGRMDYSDVRGCNLLWEGAPWDANAPQ